MNDFTPSPEAAIPASPPRLLIPRLAPLYDLLTPLSWPLIRCATGLILAVHGWGKISKGPEVVAPVFERLGFEPALAVVYLLIFVEFFGGISLALACSPDFLRRPSPLKWR